MAVNLKFLANELFKDKKIIVWAHNYHIRKANEETRYWNRYWSYEGHAPGCRTMGSELVDRSQKDGIYVVGFYMYQGSAAWNTRETYPIPVPAASSLEGRLGLVEEDYLFLDLASNLSGTLPTWLTEAIPARQWGLWYLSMKIRDQYDGILFIRNVRPPTCIN